jgi:4-amino-4-deoxy-L-arabinose transferase-like glycosyltransferase
LWWLSIAIYAALVLPRLASRGMFRDGVLYAAISRNLATGIGGWWSPRYTMHPSVFHEHPPGAFWLQSLWFHVLGDAVWVEALYSAATGVLLLLLLAAVWRRLAPHDEHTPGAWAPAILFLSSPLVSWIYASNMLENSLVLFTTAATVCVLAAVTKPARSAWAWGGIAGLLVGAAVLVKGPVGTFPVAVPVAAGLVGLARSRRAVLATLAGNAAGAALVAGAVWSSEAARTFLEVYGEKQILASVAGAREHRASRWYLVGRLGSELALPASLCVLLLAATRRSAREHARLRCSRPAFLALLIALAASMPLLISPKQHGWYLLPSLPFYAIALALVVARPARRLQESLVRRSRAVHATTLLLLSGAVVAVILEAGVVRKEQAFHADFSTQPLDIEVGTQIDVCPAELVHSWSLVLNLARQYQVDLVNDPASPYLLVEVAGDCDIPPSCAPLHPPAPRQYQMYRCAPAPEEKPPEPKSPG